MDTKNWSDILPNVNNIHFFWEGGISDKRLEILQNCVYSTRVFNPLRDIWVFSNTLHQSQFDDKFGIKVVRWDESLFYDIPIDIEHIRKWYLSAHSRDLSDLFRIVVLYKLGGSYIDTDDLGIAPITSTNNKNIVCRSYDPHTYHYNKGLTLDGLIDGKWRETGTFENLPIFPRNDCWLNFEPNSHFIEDLLSHPKIMGTDGLISIYNESISWQLLSLETCIKNIDTINKDWVLGLTLLYLYEDFVAHSSYYDKCQYGGEMCEIWNDLPNVNGYRWGEYKTSQTVANEFYEGVVKRYPYLSHLWLHHKDAKEEWFGEPNELSSVSTWMYWNVKQRINEWK